MFPIRPSVSGGWFVLSPTVAVRYRCFRSDLLSGGLLSALPSLSLVTLNILPGELVRWLRQGKALTAKPEDPGCSVPANPTEEGGNSFPEVVL